MQGAADRSVKLPNYIRTGYQPVFGMAWLSDRPDLRRMNTGKILAFHQF